MSQHQVKPGPSQGTRFASYLHAAWIKEKNSDFLHLNYNCKFRSILLCSPEFVFQKQTFWSEKVDFLGRSTGNVGHSSEA